MEMSANLLSLSFKFIALFSAYSKPLFIDLSIYPHYLYCNMYRVMACPLYFITHTPSYAMVRCIENLNGLSIIFYCSHSMDQATLRRI